MLILPRYLLEKQYTVPHDAIFCRNVMIYFDQNTQQEICAALFRSLNPTDCCLRVTLKFSHLERRFTLRGQTVYALSKD